MDDPTPSVQIVAIGASAGGMNALIEFFSVMPTDSGLAFVVIQHLDPNQVSHMASLLARCTAMTVVQAEDRAPVEANCVYTIPPGKFLAVEDGMLRLSEPVKSDGIRLPIDFSCARWRKINARRRSPCFYPAAVQTARSASERSAGPAGSSLRRIPRAPNLTP